MNEEVARNWIVERFGAGATERVRQFLELAIAENHEQNLVAPSTIASIWVRHALDSAQLLRWDNGGLWMDIGTGGGFPGMIVALLRTAPVVMVEPRRRRAAFLQSCVVRFSLAHATVEQRTVETVRQQADVISARAVASIEKLVAAAHHCATRGTRWLLPRGMLANTDMSLIEKNWPGSFHVEQSLTEPQSSVLILNGSASA